MSNNDELLQQKLLALETGIPLEMVLAGIGSENQELLELIRLAAAMRSLPHPEMRAEHAQIQQEQLAAARSGATLAAKRNGYRADERLQLDRKGSRPQPGIAAFFENLFPGLKSARLSAFAPAMAVAGLVLLVVVVSLAGLSAWLAGPSGAQVVRVMDVDGQVEVASSHLGGDWQQVANGDQLRSGQRIRSWDAAHATLVFFDGSRTTLAPNSDLTFSKVDGDWGNVLRVALTQNRGKISNSVVPLRGKASSFIVLTPSGAASVHGTTFSVAVDAKGKSRFAVDTGRVLVSNTSSEVFLTAGQAMAGWVDQSFDQPAYQFALVGDLTANQGSTWIVAGVPFTVDDATVISGDIQIGDRVLVEGRVLEDSSWIADSIELAADGEQTSTFTGILQKMEGDTWQIGGWNVMVDDDTQLGEGLQVGSAVKVTFRLSADGRWLAVQIKALETEEPEPSATPTATPDPNAMPSLSFTPDELLSTGCDLDFSLTGTLVNTADEPDDIAANVELTYQIVTGVEYVDTVDLSPATWETIAAGEQVNFAIHARLNQSWSSLPPGSEVKLRVFVLHESNRPDHHPTRLTVTLVNSCADTATSTPTPTVTEAVSSTVTATPTFTSTATFTPTPVITGTVTATPVPPAGTPSVCTGAQPHPTGLRLAQRYGVPYEEIMGWFCRGFGFGEIELAYSLSRESGLPVTTIFEMRMSGLGWGQIMQQLSSKPGKANPGKPGNPGPPDHPGTPQNPGPPHQPGPPNKPGRPRP